MNLPQPGDFIDIHDHGTASAGPKFTIENLMAHEARIPDLKANVSYSVGIHPWYLTASNMNDQLETIRQYAGHINVIAIGEAGFDKLRGPAISLQRLAFIEQVKIAEDISKPVFIHCVRAWDELTLARKELKPKKPWIVHGFRGKRELALQLISKDMYLSFWFDFIIRPESSSLVRSIPADRIFLETDGSGEDIGNIYRKVACDLGIDVEELKIKIAENYKKVFNTL